MMFTVRWEALALEELTLAWVAASSALRQAITQATDELDQRLATDPYSGSESRSGERRILFQTPLAIHFHVAQEDQTVSILHVWVFRTHA
jgi:plasmid stabilization system protein ParE